MKRFWLLFIVFSIAVAGTGQITPPYLSSFETNDPNWIHYAGPNSIDEWQRGNGTNNYAIPSDGFFAWCTNVNNYFNKGNYYLESPSFDLSDTNNTYVISFLHKHNFPNTTGSRGRVEYSTDNGNNWNTLSIANADEKENWHTNISWNEGFFNTNSNYKRARASLYGLRGNNNVKFRFAFYSPNDQGNYYGWIIDEFEIKILDKPDLRAISGSTINGEPSNKTSFDVLLGYTLEEEFKNYQGKVQIYHSLDNVLDAGDLFLDSINYNYQITSYPIQYTVNNTGFIQGGLNYIIYHHDYDGDIDETDETNNIGHTIINAEPVYSLPYHEDFETNNPDMKEYSCNGTSTTCQIPYTTGYGEYQSLSGSHSGNKSWFIENDQSLSNYYGRIEFPFIDLVNDNVLHFFYKTKHNPAVTLNRMYEWNNNLYWSSFGSYVSHNDDKGWDYQVTNIDSSWGPVFKIKIECSLGTWESGFAIDDLYIGPSEADLLLSKTETARNTTTNLSTDTLFYDLMNCGTENTVSTTTKFYSSNDSILDPGDLLLGQVTEPIMLPQSEMRRKFYYTKPNQISGEYYIIAKVDADSIQNEMREYNNLRIFKVYQRNSVSTPYFNDFETAIDGWYHYSDYKDNDVFFWGASHPSMTEISGKAFGADSLVKSVKDSRSLLYTPIFDFTGMTKPVLMFDLALISTPDGYFDNQLNIDYSTDGGATWQLLDTSNGSFKRWYNRYDYDDIGGDAFIFDSYSYDSFLYKFSENRFSENGFYFGEDDDSTRNSILDVWFLKNYDRVQFRFNYGVDYDDKDTKLYIDNFEITEGEIDLTLDYTKDLYISDQSTEIELEYHIRNLGNYMNSPTVLNIYLSADSLLDGSDLQVATNVYVDSIGPDQRKHFFESLTFSSGSLIGKNYILLDIDPNNIISESNEANNLTFYRLKTNGIQNYPYLEGFNEYEYHGWRSYNIRNSVYETRDHYFSNRVYSHHGWHDDYQIDGQMNVDKFNTTTSYYPEVYLESPSFDLTNMDSVYLSFNYSMSTNQTSNSNQEGANLEYSTDGGQNWSVLGAYNDPNGINWYNRDNVGKLDNGPGWTNCDASYYSAIYNASSILGNLSDVTFRFRMNSRWNCYYPGPSGLKMDNFRLSDTLPETDLVAIEFGDTIEIVNSGTWPVQDDSIQISFYNEGDLPATSHINVYWSTDSIYDQNDQGAGSLNFYSASPNDTTTVAGLVTYPSSCDSTLYLVYRINPFIGNPNQPHNWTYSIYENDTTNNTGYFVVNLKDHHLILPNKQLNHITDTILCDGDSLVLKPDSSYFNWNFMWSNGSTNSTLAVKDSGSYWVTITSFNGCSATSDTINIDFMFNDVNLMVNGNTRFCSGDSANLYITELGTVSWSGTISTDSSVYVQSAGDHIVTLVNPSGCISRDTLSLIMDFNTKPFISDYDTIHYCKDIALVEAIMEYDNYNWNTGDTTRIIPISTNGIYYLEINSGCGLQTSDTLYANFHQLIDSITPGNNIVACENDTVHFIAHSSSSPITNWYQANGSSSTLFSEYFSYTNGPLYPNVQMLPWRVTSNDTNYLSKVGIASGRLEVNPTGDSIVFSTDLIDISDYYNINLQLNVGNQITDSLYIYYELDNGARRRFETNGSVASNTNANASQSILEGSTIKIIVVFNGTSVLPSFNQSINDILINGRQKSGSWSLHSGNAYDHVVANDFNFLVTANNGYCVEEKVVVLTESTFNLNSYSQYTCPDINDTICPFSQIPPNYSITWPSNPIIYGFNDSCAYINAARDTFIVTTVTNEMGCERQQSISIYVTNIDTTINQSGNVLSSVTPGFYQWLDCDNNYSPISGANQYNYTVTQDGSYAVQISSNGCVDTSRCVTFSCLTPVNNNVTMLGNTITSVQSGASYQWIDCSTNSPIMGAINQSFTPTANGQYAVIVTIGSCIDTSMCVNVTGVSINETNQIHGLSVYPNPTNGNIFIDLGTHYEKFDIVISNVLGENVLLYSNVNEGNKHEINLDPLTKGIYFMHITVGKKMSIVKVVKE